MGDTGKQPGGGGKDTGRKSAGLKGFRNFMIAACVALSLRFFVMEPFQIPTGSMEPTLIGREGYGDRIFAGKFSYSRRVGGDPKRWDVVVFYHKEPGEKKKRLVKRLAGLPGETIEICDGDVFANGEIVRKPEELQQVLWHRLYDGNFADPVERRHWPWIVEKGPIEAWIMGDDGLVVTNDAEDAGPTAVRYDGSQRGVRLTNIYLRRAYRLYDCPVCNSGVFAPVDTAHTWINCPACDKERDRPFDFNVLKENMMRERPFRERYPWRTRDEVSVNDLAAEAVWKGDGDRGGDVKLSLETRGRCFWARFIPNSGTVVVGGAGPGDSQETIKVNVTGRHYGLRLAFWDSTLVVYWDGAKVWRKEMKPLRRPAENLKESSSVTITVGRGTTVFERVSIDRDIYYTTEPSGEHGAMSRSAFGEFYKLGGDEYFFLGDNSPSSKDSRYWGSIKREDLVGRAWFVFWPLDRIRWIK
ncbi:MAG: signal peptidase I [Planctomycetes bacterium]|nr:signal peptidase I [Planctomycetota bacterium]